MNNHQSEALTELHQTYTIFLGRFTSVNYQLKIPFDSHFSDRKQFALTCIREKKLTVKLWKIPCFASNCTLHNFPSSVSVFILVINSVWRENIIFHSFKHWNEWKL